MTNGKIATAVVGGYLLGRTKKGKLALSLGMLLAGRKLNPQDLVKAVAGSPLVGGLSDQVRKDLMEGTRSAAGRALEARMNHFADTLHERSTALEGGDGEGRDEEEDQAGPEDDDERGEEEPESAPEERPARTARKKTGGTARKTAGTARTAKKTAKTAKSAKTAKATGSRSAKAARGGNDE
jgi:hypothetical protein